MFEKNKLRIFIFISILPFIFCSCYINKDNLLFKKSKPSNFYYTQGLKNSLTNEKDCLINVVYMNFYKGKRLDESEILTMKKFLKFLRKENFIEKPKNIPSKPVYKVYLNFNSTKYVINVYNDRYLSVYPWDGDYAVDYIDMKDVYTSFNLFQLCQYVISQTK